MKLTTFQGSNTLIITNTAHGANQNNCAFDFGWKGVGSPVTKKLYAPCDGEVLYNKIQPDGDQYFNFGTKDFYIQFVHDKPLRMGSFKRGELLGESIKDHHHVAINVGGGWHWIFDYMDRNTNLYFWNYPNQNNKWAKWSSYPADLQLPSPIPVETCEIKLAAANARIAELEKELKKYTLHIGDLYEKSA